MWCLDIPATCRVVVHLPGSGPDLGDEFELACRALEPLATFVRPAGSGSDALAEGVALADGIGGGDVAALADGRFPAVFLSLFLSIVLDRPAGVTAESALPDGTVYYWS